VPAVADASGGKSSDSAGSGSNAATESEKNKGPAAEVVELDAFRKK
jgi:hypothetical protein